MMARAPPLLYQASNFLYVLGNALMGNGVTPSGRKKPKQLLKQPIRWLRVNWDNSLSKPGNDAFVTDNGWVQKCTRVSVTPSTGGWVCAIWQWSWMRRLGSTSHIVIAPLFDSPLLWLRKTKVFLTLSPPPIRYVFISLLSYSGLGSLVFRITLRLFVFSQNFNSQTFILKDF